MPSNDVSGTVDSVKDTKLLATGSQVRAQSGTPRSDGADRESKAVQ